MLWMWFSGVGTLIGTVLMIVSTLLDVFPKLHGRRGPVTISVCAALFLIGLPLTSQVMQLWEHEFSIVSKVVGYGLENLQSVSSRGTDTYSVSISSLLWAPSSTSLSTGRFTPNVKQPEHAAPWSLQAFMMRYLSTGCYAIWFPCHHMHTVCRPFYLNWDTFR